MKCNFNDYFKTLYYSITDAEPPLETSQTAPHQPTATMPIPKPALKRPVTTHDQTRNQYLKKITQGSFLAGKSNDFEFKMLFNRSEGSRI
jgi:hypothetical protein